MITLYHSPASRSVRIRWSFEELGLGCRLERLSLSDGSLQRPLARLLDVVEKELASRDTLRPSGFSAADVMLGYALQLAKLLGQLPEERRRASGYLARLAARPAFQKAFAD